MASLESRPSPRLTAREKADEHHHHHHHHRRRRQPLLQCNIEEDKLSWNQLRMDDWEGVWKASKLANTIAKSPLDFLPSHSSAGEHRSALQAALGVLDAIATPADLNRLVESFRKGTRDSPYKRPRPARVDEGPNTTDLSIKKSGGVAGKRSGRSSGRAAVIGGVQAEDTTHSNASLPAPEGGPTKRRRGRKPGPVAKAKPRQETEKEKEERLKAIQLVVDETREEVQRQHNKVSKWSTNKTKEESSTGTDSSWRRRSPARSATSSEISSSAAPVVSDKIKSLSASIKELLGSTKNATVEAAGGEKTSNGKGVKREAEVAKKPRQTKRPRQAKVAKPKPTPVQEVIPPRESKESASSSETPVAAAAEVLPVSVSSPSPSSSVPTIAVSPSTVSSGSALDDLYSALSREMGVE